MMLIMFVTTLNNFLIMLRVCVLGDGILGNEIKIKTDFKIFSRNLKNLDIHDNLLIENIIKDHDVIINCIANTDSYSLDYLSHWKINYQFPKNLVKLTNKYNKKLIQISTEFVYSQNINLPTEEDDPIPNLSYYSISKLLADIFIQNHCKNFLICRCFHKDKDIFYENVWDVNTCGDTVDKIADIIIKLISMNAEGLFNVGTGPKNLSKIIKGDNIIKPPKNVPIDTQMDLNKLENFINENYTD